LPRGIASGEQFVQLLVLKGSQHQHETLVGLDVGKERVVRILCLGGEDAGIVAVFDMGVNGLFGVVKFAEFGHPFIRNLHHANVGFGGRGGVFICAGRASGEGIENGGLAAFGRSDEGYFHGLGFSTRLFRERSSAPLR